MGRLYQNVDLTEIVRVCLCVLDSYGPIQGPVVCCCKKSYELDSYIHGEKFLDYLSNSQSMSTIYAPIRVPEINFVLRPFFILKIEVAYF